MSLPALAQPRKKKPVEPPAPPPLEQKAEQKAERPEAGPVAKKGPVKEQNLDLQGLGLNGRTRSPQLLYFLERANEELERASLEKRSFIPSIVKTVEDEQL